MLGERFGEAQAGAPRERLNRVQGNVENAGDVSQAQAADTAEQQYLALLQGKARQGLLQPGYGLVDLRQRLGTVVRARPAVHGGIAGAPAA